MTNTNLGGHAGLDVFRRPDETYGSVVVKVARDEANVDGLERARMALIAMDGTDLAPRLLREARGKGVEHGGLYETQESDLGTSQPVADGEVLRHAAIRMLIGIRGRGLRHGDLTGPRVDGQSNLIWDGVVLRAVDWQEAHPMDAPPPQKQPWSDSWLLMRTLSSWSAIDGFSDTPRIARRWQAVLGALGADAAVPSLPCRGRTFVDYGCFQGDFVALAAAEGMLAVGIDRGGFRSGEDSIEIARERWRTVNAVGDIAFRNADMFSEVHPADVAMCFSAWSYMVIERGWDVALDWLRQVIQQSSVMFFETQLAGDGPGTGALQTDDDVAAMLRSVGGEPTAIVTIPVTGRNAARTVWSVVRDSPT